MTDEIAVIKFRKFRQKYCYICWHRVIIVQYILEIGREYRETTRGQFDLWLAVNCETSRRYDSEKAE